MGVTTIDEVTVNAIKNWTAVVERERNAAVLWNDKWGWIVDEYRELVESLVDLKSHRAYVEAKQKADKRTVLPFPVTTAQEIGWISTKPEFLLERFGPYPNTRKWNRPLDPPEGFGDNELAENFEEFY